MSESKVPCVQCGAEILAATARRTGGICMPCKNGGGAPEWARRRLWIKHGADPFANTPWYQSPWGHEVVSTCQQLAAGELGCLEGSRRMAKLAELVLDAAHGDKWLHPDWAIFLEVLASQDQKRGVESSFSGQVRTAALKLLKEAESSV